MPKSAETIKILHLETSSKNSSVAVSEGKNLLCLCEQVAENYRQSENLHTFVQWALEGAGIALQEIDAVCLGKGPGSYTGLRIGAAAAKGFCFGLNVPLLAVNSLQSMIPDFLNRGYDYVVPLIDARRSEVYCAAYDGGSGVMKMETKAEILDGNSFSDLVGKKVIFVGDGARKAKDILQLNMATYEPDMYPTAKNMILPALEEFAASAWEDSAYFEPFYLKDFQGVKKKTRE